MTTKPAPKPDAPKTEDEEVLADNPGDEYVEFRSLATVLARQVTESETVVTSDRILIASIGDWILHSPNGQVTVMQDEAFQADWEAD